MSAKNLVLGWTVSETIGVAVVNPRGVSSMHAMPRYSFQSETGSIEIMRYSIVITGAIEGAAKAFAEAILSRKITKPDYETWQYCEVIDVVCINNKYSLTLTGNGLGLIDPDVWIQFRKNVYTILNNARAFL